MTAELIREAIFKHQRINVTNAIIEGQLDCENEVLEEDLVFKNCRFKEHVNFAYARFKQAVSFVGSEFDKGVRLEFASVAQNVDLSRTRFHGGKANFTGLHCEGMVWGSGIRSSEKARVSFDFCDVQGFILVSSIFDGIFSCAKSHLQGLVGFIAVKFNHDAFFGMTVFDGMVLFLPGGSFSDVPGISPTDPSGFEQGANFPMAEFKGYALFAVDFRGSANFNGVRGDAELLFGSAKNAPAQWQISDSIVFAGKATFTGMDAKRLSFERVVFKQCADFSAISVSENVRFEGDHYEQVDRVMFSDCFIFRRARIGGSVIFTECGFGGEVDFRSATIAGDLSFNEETAHAKPPSIFGGSASFDRVHVGGDLRFDSRLFAKGLFLVSAKIGANVMFRGFIENKAAPVTFLEDVDFSGADIQKRLIASGVVFNGQLQVQSTTIGAVEFRADPHNGLGPAEVNGDAYFSGSELEWAFFEGAKFKNVANFDAMDIKREGRFQGTTFAGPLSFRATRCAGGFHFEGASLNDATFRGAVVKSLSFSDPFGLSKNTKFGGNIDFRGCSYERIDVDWSHLIDRIEPFDRQAYTQLQKSLYSAGESDAAAEVYKNRLVREVGSRWWLWVAYIWPWISAKPFQLVVASVFVVLGGCLAFLVLPRSYEAKDEGGLKALGPLQATVPGDLPKPAIPQMFRRVGDALALSIRAFIPFETAVGAHLAPRRPAGTTISLVLRLCGWALLAMLIAAASGLFRASP